MDAIAQLSSAYGQIGAVLGSSYQQYRSMVAASPAIAPASLIATLQGIAFDQSSALTFKAPSTFGKPIYYGAFDPRIVQAGDYLVGELGTLYVASLEPGKPALCVQCNRTISFFRDAASVAGTAGFGATQRSGNAGSQRSNKAEYLNEWPASVLEGTKGENSSAGLPDDVRSPWVKVMLPAIPGKTIETTDQFSDDLRRTFTVSSVELTDLGYRLTAAYADT